MWSGSCVPEEDHQHRLQKKVSNQEEQIAWMICKCFMVSDTDEPVLDLDEILRVGLKNDNVQSFSTRWDETIFAMKKQPDSLTVIAVLYNQDTAQKGASRDCTKLKK